MNLSKDEMAFRDEVRAFLAAELTDEIRLGGHRTSGIFSDYEVGIPWQRVLAKRGWAAPHWPVEWVVAAGRPSSTTFLPVRWRQPTPPKSHLWAW